MILHNRILFNLDQLVCSFLGRLFCLKILISLDLSQADVRLKLAQQDAFDLQRVGMSVSVEKGPSAMIYEGIELEESQ